VTCPAPFEKYEGLCLFFTSEYTSSNSEAAGICKPYRADLPFFLDATEYDSFKAYL